jgi:hypothetical protein
MDLSRRSSGAYMSMVFFNGPSRWRTPLAGDVSALEWTAQAQESEASAKTSHETLKRKKDH